jgi:molybdate transport system permease protein
MDQTVLGIAAFTLATAALAMALALPVAVAAAWLLARASFRGKSIVETLVSLPLVLPPVAVGLLLLQLLGRTRPLGRLLDTAGLEVVFTWRAVVLAMAVMSLPLMVMTIRAGLEQVDRRFERMAETLGAGAWRVAATITLPLARRSVLAGALLGFARALGEFGATIVVAGGIPGQTQTLAVAIFNLTEAGREQDANRLMLVSIALAFVALAAANALLRRGRSRT